MRPLSPASIQRGNINHENLNENDGTRMKMKEDSISSSSDGGDLLGSDIDTDSNMSDDVVADVVVADDVVEEEHGHKDN